MSLFKMEIIITHWKGSYKYNFILLCIYKRKKNIKIFNYWKCKKTKSHFSHLHPFIKTPKRMAKYARKLFLSYTYFYIRWKIFHFFCKFNLCVYYFSNKLTLTTSIKPIFLKELDRRERERKNEKRKKEWNKSMEIR